MTRAAGRRGRHAVVLSAADQTLLAALARRHDRSGRWASALLAVAEGATQRAAAEQAGLSERQVRAWQVAWETRGRAIFPAAVLAAAAASIDDQKPAHSVTTPKAPKPANSRRTAAKVPASGSSADAAATTRARKANAGEGLSPDDTVARAAHQALQRHLAQMLRHEAGTRQGEDPEALHDMRVATRRMRATLEICQPYLSPNATRRINPNLRRLARRLGAVRDLDVFGEANARYLATLDAAERAELQPLVDAWWTRREQARGALLRWLDGPRYPKLTSALSAFVDDPKAGERDPFGDDGMVRPRRLRHVVPALVLARHAAVRAFEEWLPGSVATPAAGQPESMAAPLDRYHALRISTKRLRYALEVFAEILGPEVDGLLADLKALQEHLGALQDAVVACQMLRDLLVWGSFTPSATTLPDTPVVAPAVASYLAAQQHELARLVTTFSAVWPRVAGAGFRARLLSSLVWLDGSPTATNAPTPAADTPRERTRPTHS